MIVDNKYTFDFQLLIEYQAIDACIFLHSLFEIEIGESPLADPGSVKIA